MSATPARQPAGVPTGGQFAAKANPECGVELSDAEMTVERSHYPDGSVESEVPAPRSSSVLHPTAHSLPIASSRRQRAISRWRARR